MVHFLQSLPYRQFSVKFTCNNNLDNLYCLYISNVIIHLQETESAAPNKIASGASNAFNASNAFCTNF